MPGRIAHALTLASVLAGPAHGQGVIPKAPGPAPPEAASASPTAPARRAAQGLGIGAAILVAGGIALLVDGVLSYSAVRDGCGTTTSCAPPDLQPGKTALTVGWVAGGAGVAAGLAAMILAAVDGRAGAARGPPAEPGARLTGIAPFADARSAGLALSARF